MYKLKWEENGIDLELNLYCGDECLDKIAELQNNNGIYCITYFVYGGLLNEYWEIKTSRKLESAKSYIIKHLTDINNKLQIAITNPEGD